MTPPAKLPNCHPRAVQLYVDVSCDASFWLLPPSINNPTPSVARQGGDRLGLGADFESKRWVLHSKYFTRLACSARTLLMSCCRGWIRIG